MIFVLVANGAAATGRATGHPGGRRLLGYFASSAAAAATATDAFGRTAAFATTARLGGQKPRQGGGHRGGQKAGDGQLVQDPLQAVQEQRDNGRVRNADASNATERHNGNIDDDAVAKLLRAADDGQQTSHRAEGTAAGESYSSRALSVALGDRQKRA